MIRVFLAGRDHTDPFVASAFVRLNFLLVLITLAWSISALQFGVQERMRAFTIHATMAILSYAIRAWGLHQTTLAGIRRVAHVAGACVTGGLFVAATNSGLGHAVEAWYLVCVPAAIVFLIGGRAGGIWVVVTALMLVVLNHLESQAPREPEFLVTGWERAAAHVGLTLILATFAGATRRASERHVDTLESHDRELLAQNRRLQAEILEHEQTQEALATARDAAEEARALAEEANRSKSEFLANMSHELRTPLNAVIGYGELVVEDLPNKDAESLDVDMSRILDAARHLLGLINDLLDISKIEAGRTELHLENFDIRPIVEDLVETVGPIAERTGTRIDVEIDDALGTMWADKTRVRQVLLNLLSNAAKFTRDGRACVRVTPTITGGRRWFVIEVEDDGIGMSEAQMSQIFEPFRQADPSTTRDFGGTGLGLAISRTYCEMLGGSITVRSEKGTGSCFTVRLPAEANTASLEHPSSGPVPVVSGSNPGVRTVLVVDDDPAAREIMTRYLTKASYYVVTAPTGEAGIELARRIRPDVITLDVRLPIADGWSVLTTLKGDDVTRDIPVVMVTMVEDREIGYALGATNFLVKPVERTHLIEALDTCIRTQVESA